MPPQGEEQRRGHARWRPRRWSELTEVERVDLYTRQSLYGVLAAVCTLVLAGATAELGDGSYDLWFYAGGAIVGVAGLWALRVLFDRYPVVWPLPVKPVATLLVLSVAYVAAAAIAFPPELIGPAAAIAGVTLAITLGLLPDNRIAAALLVLGFIGSALVEGQLVAGISGLFVIGAFLATARLSMWLVQTVRDVDEARQAQSELAVMEERLRFSRDVHDVLGRRLSTIAVQSELAATLAKRGDERAAEQMLEVREIAHQALREARELARGYRTTQFSQELEGARSLLLAAGIDVQLRVDELPQAWHEPAGWVVRESITNVLRHSNATLVQISYRDGSLRVENDAAHTASGGDGSGLDGLRERLQPLGAVLTAEPADGDRWLVTATFPGSGPLSSKTTGGASL